MNRQFTTCSSLFSKGHEIMDLRLGHKLGEGEEGREGIVHGLLVIFIGSNSGQLLQSEASNEVQSLRSKPNPF